MATVCGRSTYRGRGQASAYSQKKVVRKVITLTSVSVSDRIRDLFDLDNVHVLCYISTMIEIKYWNKVPSPFLLPHPKTDRPGQIKKKKKKGCRTASAAFLLNVLYSERHRMICRLETLDLIPDRRRRSAF